MDARSPGERAIERMPARAGVEGNARLTSGLGAVVFVLLAIEGVTILRIRTLLDPHVFVGVVLIPVALTKISSAGWRFMKYYAGNPEYRRKGPPAIALRLLGPFVIVLTLVLLGSGVGLVLLPTTYRAELFFVHRASFILWIAALTIHVLGHIGETARLAPRDWLTRTRRQVGGATARQWALVWSVAVGLFAAIAVTPHAIGWFSK